METLSNSTEKQTAAASGFRLGFIVVVLLVPLMGPVLNSDGWANWDEGRKLWKAAKWVIDIGISLGLVFIPSVRHMFRLLPVFPWMFAIGFVLALVIGINGGHHSALHIVQIAHLGISTVAWFAFLRRYPFVVQPYKYSDADWRRLTVPEVLK
ncbi:MAG: hypothetical protein ABL962_13845, partial [Fimbriimonadaceae bacterium]